MNVDVPLADAEAAAGALDLPVLPLAEIDQFGIGASTVHPSAAGPRDASGPNAYVLAQASGTLCDAVAGGDLTREHEDGLTGPQAGVSLSVWRVRDDQIVRAQLGEGTTLIERTMYQFGERTTRFGPEPCPAVV